MIAERLEIVPVGGVARDHPRRLRASRTIERPAPSAAIARRRGLQDGDRPRRSDLRPGDERRRPAVATSRVPLEVAAQAVGTVLMERLRTRTLDVYG